MATLTKPRKPPTPAQTDKMLAAINLRYAVAKMADRYAQASHQRATMEGSPDLDPDKYDRLCRRERRQRATLGRLLDASLLAYKEEAYR